MAIPKLRTLLILATIPLAILGTGLILFALFYQPAPHAVFWYWQEGKVYRYDTKTKVTYPVDLPSQGAIAAAKLSPNSELIAFTDDEGLKISSKPFTTAQLIGRNEQQVMSTKPKVVITKIFTAGNWSQTGEQLIVNRYGWDINYLYVFFVKSGLLMPIGVGQESPINQWGCGSDPGFSPDGNYLVISDEGFGLCSFPGGVSLYDIDGRSMERIYSEEQPIGFNLAMQLLTYDGGSHDATWSPSGEWIAFNQEYYDPAEDIAGSRLMLIRPDDLRREILVEDGGTNPLWTADSKTVYYQKDGSLFSISLETKTTNKIAEIGDDQPIAVSPDNRWISLYRKETNTNLVYESLWMLDLLTNKTIRIGEIVERDWPSTIGFIGWQMIP